VRFFSFRTHLILNGRVGRSLSLSQLPENAVLGSNDDPEDFVFIVNGLGLGCHVACAKQASVCAFHAVGNNGSYYRIVRRSPANSSAWVSQEFLCDDLPPSRALTLDSEITQTWCSL